jgi:hypothetical protein
MNVSNHALQRYCQRVKGITDEKEVKQYVSQNREEMIREVNQLLESSKLIYSGQLNGEQSEAEFYIRDNLGRRL